MQAIILAGGKGTRLRPYTTEIPKPLVSIDDMPIIEILLLRMKKFGVNKVTIAVNHLAHLIMAVLEDGQRLGLNITYSLEDKPLSTVGPIKLIKDLDNHFIVANGDILTDLNFQELFDYHLKNNALLTVATHQRYNKIDYGVIKKTEGNRITGFEEKPIFDFTVSMGIYVFSKKIMEYVPEDSIFGFDHLMFKLLEQNEKIISYPFNGYWMDIGRPDDYEQAKIDVQIIRSLLD